MRKILFATDYSPASQQALYFASSLARDTGATLLIVHVREMAGYSAGELANEGPEASEAELRELHAVVPTGPKITCEYRFLHGQPADQIVELARREDVNIIVLGTQGHSRLSHLLAGSVAQAVMREAPCAVIAYKPAARVAVADVP